MAGILKVDGCYAAGAIPRKACGRQARAVRRLRHGSQRKALWTGAFRCFISALSPLAPGRMAEIQGHLSFTRAWRVITIMPWLCTAQRGPSFVAPLRKAMTWTSSFQTFARRPLSTAGGRIET
ncbi:hypothetical protein FQZ97_988480 [compost metagenome]